MFGIMRHATRHQPLTLVGRSLLDMAYTFRTGTVASAATHTTAFQHLILTFIMYHF